MGKIIGIDLGTTNSVVAVAEHTGADAGADEPGDPGEAAQPIH